MALRTSDGRVFDDLSELRGDSPGCAASGHHHQMGDERDQEAPDGIADDVASALGELDALMNRWNLALGPVRISRHLNSMSVAWLVVGFNLVLATVGAFMIFAPDPLRSLGIALVVGALFAIGAFIAQVWAAQVAREYILCEEEIREKVREIRELSDEGEHVES
jgi:hypothetical protein